MNRKPFFFFGKPDFEFGSGKLKMFNYIGKFNDQKDQKARCEVYFYKNRAFLIRKSKKTVTDDSKIFNQNNELVFVYKRISKRAKNYLFNDKDLKKEHLMEDVSR